MAINNPKYKKSKPTLVIEVQRADYLKDPYHYAGQANNRRRVFVSNELGEVIKVIGGHLNYSQR